MIPFLFGLAFGDTGSLVLHTFGEDSLPYAYADIRLIDPNGKSIEHRSDEFGVLTLSLEEGNYLIMWGERTEKIEIVASEESFSLIFEHTIQ